MSRLGARSHRGMVTAPHHLAAQAGRDVLREGGNAVEAAVATAATLAVVYPHMTGIGGDAFFLVAEPDGAAWSVHGCGGAGARVDAALYAGRAAIPWRGPLAANTVAGAVSGWAAALERLGGTLPLARLLADAIGHAEDGVAVTHGGAAIATAKGDELRIQPRAYAATFEPEGRPLREGERLRQPRLAATLRRLAAEGIASFYTGALAAEIAADLVDVRSPIEAADLATHTATTPAPLHARVTGATLRNSAPPTQGAASLLILALFDRLHVDAANGFAHVHGLVEATKRAFLLRDTHCGDPATHAFDWQALLSDGAVLERMAGEIDPTRALPWPRSSATGPHAGSRPPTRTAAW